LVDSASKTPVDRALAAAMVERAFGGERRLVRADPCEEGWFNAVHRLGLDDGSSVVLKVAPPPEVRVLRYEQGLITTEVDALRLVRERTDVPVPEVLFWDQSCELVPSPWFVMTVCPGALLSEVRTSLDEAAGAAVDAQLARIVASVNALTADRFGRPEPSAPRDDRWSTAFMRLVEDLLRDASGADLDLPIAAADLRSVLDTEVLDVVTTPRLVHWDLWDTNVFVDDDAMVVGVIDFERVLWADPLMEAQFVGRRVHDEVVEAYGTPLFDQPGAVERRRLYDLYLGLVMTVECAYRHYPTADIEQLGRGLMVEAFAELC
jgi:aminoglycoside phosphotransferase (APT) family kinase protein